MTKPTREAVCFEPDTWPAPIDNRPSQARIAYRIGTYVDARRHLLNELDEDAVLASWTYRGADDPGIAIYEGAAEIAEILTFYQEVYANEAYLRTATWRESVADLVRLTGYRLAPGIGGTGTFAIEATGDSPITVPAGTAITAQLATEPATASFETTSTVTALPWLSRFSLQRPQLPAQIRNGITNQLVVLDPAQTFQPGDRVLIGVSDGSLTAPTALSPWEIAVVSSTDTWNGFALLTLKGPVMKCGDHAALSAFKLGDTFKHFGANAPTQYLPVGETTTSSISTSRDFSAPQAESSNPPRYPAFEKTDVPLDPPSTKLALGGQLAIELYQPATWKHWHSPYEPARSWLWIRTIADLRSVSAQFGAVTGPATVASLDRELADITADIREIQIDEITTPAFRVSAPWTDDSTLFPAGNTLYWWGDVDQAKTLVDRSIAVVLATGESYTRTVTKVASAAVLAAGLAFVQLDQAVAAADFESGSTTAVFGNLVGATEGKAQGPTILGNGDDQQSFQSFQIPIGPLTYLNEPTAAPPAQPQVTVTVGNRIWAYVDSLYGQAADAEVYVILQDNSGNFWVQFGDGVTGARLPSGVGNVQIAYRTGSGSYGAMQAGQSPSLGGHINGISSLDLPAPIEGGSPPETTSSARIAAPAHVQTLDRLVSVADIQAEALATAGVELARAAWELVDDLPCVQVAVLMQPGRIADVANVQALLTAANRSIGPARFPIQVIAGRTIYVYLDLSVAIDPTYSPDPVLAAVEAALGVTGLEADGVDGSRGLFGAGGPHGFADAEYATRVEGVAQNVEGVLWAACNAFGALGPADDPSTLVYPATPTRSDVVPCDATSVLRLYASAAPTSPLVLRTVPTGGSA